MSTRRAPGVGNWSLNATLASRSTPAGKDKHLIDNPYYSWFTRNFGVGECVSLGTLIQLLRDGGLRLDSATLTPPRTGLKVTLDRQPDGSLKFSELTESCSYSD